MAQRSLLDLHLSVRPDGAVVAAWYGRWDYAWPRDSSWVAAALAVTGHGPDRLRVLRFLGQEQSPNGTWAARYQTNGSGPVAGRPARPSWTRWAGCRGRCGPGTRPPGLVRPGAAGAGRAVADGQRRGRAAERSLTPNGLPEAATDYWEHGSQVTLGTAAPLLTGLRAAADIATALGQTWPARVGGAAERG